MSNNKQSSIQQFWDKIALKLTIDQLNEFMPLFEQAKAMHKDEIMEARTNGRWACTEKYGEVRTNIKYYNETYGGNNG